MCECKHKKITCPSCAYESCVSCIKTYLLSSIYLPHCSNCRKEWPELLMNLSDLFKKKYQSYMEHIIFLQQQTYMCGYQSIALHQNKLKQIKMIKKSIEIKRRENKMNEDQLVSTQREIDKNLTKEYKQVDQLEYDTRRNTPSKNDNVLTLCPTHSCRGFISSYQCNMCLIKVCHTCIQVHESSVGKCDSIATKECPHCKKLVYQTKEDITFCFSCHEGFSWENGPEKYIICNISKPIFLHVHPTRMSIFSVLRGIEYEKVDRYYKNIRHLRRFVINKYDTVDDLLIEQLEYMKGYNKNTFMRKCYISYMSRYRNQLEKTIVTHYIIVGEDLISMFSNNTDRNSLLITELDNLSNNAVAQLRKLNEKYPYKGIVLDKNFML